MVSVEQHVLLPLQGFRLDEQPSDSAVQELFEPYIPGHAEVVDRIPGGGPALIAIDPDVIDTANLREAGFRLARIVRYRPAWLDHTPTIQARTSAANSVTLQVVSGDDGGPVTGAGVAAIANLSTGEGVAGVTDSGGHVTLAIDGAVTYPAVFVTPRAGYWSVLKRDVVLTDGMALRLEPISPGYGDALRCIYGPAPAHTGSGVKVGVVDAGIGPHPDLTVAGGMNCVSGEAPTDYGDNGIGHGTHVGGILAGHAEPADGMRGLAPGAALMSYRVFPDGGGECTNFAVMKAIDQAVADGCQLINLSLSVDQVDDEAVSLALADARRRGSVPFAAAGNSMFGARGALVFPATDPSVLAVSAMGRIGSFPEGTLETGEAAPPFGTDPADFLARFSNAGAALALTGPGVGIISTFPGGYAVMDGTSMACPAACARAAGLLADRPEILSSPADGARADQIVKIVVAGAEPLGLGAEFEGHGLLR